MASDRTRWRFVFAVAAAALGASTGPFTPRTSVAQVRPVTSALRSPGRLTVAPDPSGSQPARAVPKPSDAADRSIGPRDGQGRPIGTAAIRGQVVDAASGSAVRRAQIRASLFDSAASWIVSTDVNGRYEIRDLPAGAFSVSATKIGYAGLQFGQQRPRDTPELVELLDNQSLERVDFRLPRGGLIAGRVVDELGDALAGATVVALERRLANGRRAMIAAGQPSTTNDLGEFRLPGLMGGRYFLVARYRSPMGLVGVGPGADRGYAATYYPGTSDSKEAQPLSVDLGEELAGIVMTLVPTPIFRISGTLRDERGAPATRCTLTLSDSSALLPVVDAIAQVREDGSFTLLNVMPGEYVLDVRAAIDGPPGHEEFASVPITVGAADVVGIDIVTSAGATLEGAVVVDRGRQPPFDTTRLNVVALPRSGDVGSPRATPVRADGSFSLEALVGPRWITVRGLPSGWALKSALLNGRDVLDAFVDVTGAREASTLTLIVADTTTTLSGIVATEQGEPVRDYSVVVFADDSRLWEFPARHVRVTRSGRNGRFEIQGLPPGRYQALAVSYMTADDALDPQFLESARAEAAEVSLAEGVDVSVRLTLSRYR